MHLSTDRKAYKMAFIVPLVILS